MFDNEAVEPNASAVPRFACAAGIAGPRSGNPEDLTLPGSALSSAGSTDDLPGLLWTRSMIPVSLVPGRCLGSAVG
jgi:hypothetical protein